MKWGGKDTYEGKTDGVTAGALHLEEVTFTEGMQTIPERFCSNMTENKNIQRVIIPESVTMIDTCAFNKCSGIEEIKIGKNVRIIGSGAFANCANLKKIIFEESDKDELASET